jgi:hypothetical protein
MGRLMMYLESFGTFSDPGTWEKRIHEARSRLAGSVVRDTDRERDLVNDLVAAVGDDEFHVYCRSRGISVKVYAQGSVDITKGTAVRHMNKPGVVRSVSGQNAEIEFFEQGRIITKMVPKSDLEVSKWVVVDNSKGGLGRVWPVRDHDFMITRAVVRDMETELSRINDALKMVVSTPGSPKPGRLRMSGRPNIELSDREGKKQEANVMLADILGKFIGKDLDFQMAYRVWFAPKKSVDIVNMESVKVEDIEFDGFQGEKGDGNVTYIRITCRSPFGQTCRIDVDKDSPTEFEDLEKDPSPEGKLVMVATSKTSGYPTATTYVVTPASYETTKMLKSIVEVLTHISKQDEDKQDDEGLGA